MCWMPNYKNNFITLIKRSYPIDRSLSIGFCISIVRSLRFKGHLPSSFNLLLTDLFILHRLSVQSRLLSQSGQILSLLLFFPGFLMFLSKVSANTASAPPGLQVYLPSFIEIICSNWGGIGLQKVSIILFDQDIRPVNKSQTS